MRTAIAAEGLVKKYGDSYALTGLDLEVRAGTVLGLLGPNGAGKTTTVRVLTTLLMPDGGRAWVNGIDVVQNPQEVRRSIGVSGQETALEPLLTGRENLELYGRLHRLGRRGARQRAQELLEQFGLTEAATRPAQTYSGGMRRRLDLAVSLITRPSVLFLDEPTTGLDPRSRSATWDVVAELVGAGTTVLLTTQYLEEADQLADLIAVVDHGRVIAQGSANELKARIGGDRIEVVLHDHELLSVAAGVLERTGTGQALVTTSERRVSVLAPHRPGLLADVLRTMEAANITVEDIGLRRPSLDDVFFSLTERPAGPVASAETTGPMNTARSTLVAA
ncbi:ATP-binding cassette domain-containing protein [Frankia sp. Cas3]|uniref:ATP-binding cassette domain-containing protein n=1 Tax=Frankia sp. Cas3 TaxID=3073926 RepID=UPI002AD3755C|nr:ATP-binding cassette domain-containing protein [Frankia sp. Cas3]